MRISLEQWLRAPYSTSMNTMHTPRTFSQFVSADLQPRAANASTIPAPTATEGAAESERRLRAALDRQTVRVPFASTSAILADLSESWSQ
jgi:hypothetical protein